MYMIITVLTVYTFISLVILFLAYLSYRSIYKIKNSSGRKPYTQVEKLVIGRVFSQALVSLSADIALITFAYLANDLVDLYLEQLFPILLTMSPFLYLLIISVSLKMQKCS